MYFIRALLITCWLSASCIAHSQEAGAPALQIIGLEKAITLTWSQLLALKHQRVSERRSVTVSGQPSDVAASSMVGATLADVLNAAGFAKLSRHTQRKAAIIAVSQDGYEAAFSWAEIFLNDSGSGMLVLWERNGASLISSEGLLALIAVNDSRTGPRHVKRLAALRILNTQ
jgi:hypothetical protein